MSLRTRLLLSYTLVSLVCVSIIFVALLFLLRDAPTQQRLVTGRLSLEAAFVQRQVRTPLQNGAPPTQIIRRLEALDARTDTRILLLNEQSGEVLGDTSGTLTGRNLFELGRPQRFNNTLRGEFDADGEHWLYSTGTLLAREPLTIVAAAPYEITSPLRDPIFRELLQPIAIALLLALGVSIVLAIIVTRSVTRPMQHVARAAQHIAHGDYDQTVPLEGPLEFKEVATNFNAMAQQVRAAQHSQRDFLANATHELKTPLTSIQGFAQAIKDGTASEPEAVRKSAGIIYDEAARMNRLVMELLELVRLESGQVVLRREPVQLAALLHGISERMQPRAQEVGIQLQIELADNLPNITGDGDRLAQVFTNLIDNALKHTPAGGKVTLAAHAIGGSSAVKRGTLRALGGVEISVADTGAGIPPDDLPHIFDRFYQVEKSRVRSKEGSVGLGLSIVKEIVTAHSGTIHAESIVGLGTKLVVWLPQG